MATQTATTLGPADLERPRREHPAATVPSTWWTRARFIAQALRVGLVVATVTDTCAMGNVPARLPFNRRRVETCDLPSLASTITTSAEPVPTAGTSEAAAT